MKKILSILLISILCLTFVGCQKSYDYEIEGLDINNISEDQQHDINLLGEILDKTYENLYNGLTRLNEASEEDRPQIAYDTNNNFIEYGLSVRSISPYYYQFKTDMFFNEYLKYDYILKGYHNIYSDYYCLKNNENYKCNHQLQSNADKIPHSLSEIDLDQLQAFYELINDLRTDKE